MINRTINKLTLLPALLASFTVVGYGQVVTPQPEIQTTKGTVIKGRAPVNRTLLQVKRPKAQETTLKNGLRVIVLENNHRLPTFSMELVVLSGGLSDPADRRGLAGATAALLREGTAKHTSREIAEQLDTIGATMGATSGLAKTPRDRVGISSQVLTRSLRDLEHNGLVERRVFAEVPVRVEYSLTDVGRTLCPIVDAMRKWAEEHKEEVAAARARYERARGPREDSA